MSDQRRAELAAGLEQVHARIDQAARSAGRDPAEVTLVVVTKTFPASDVALLADLGVRDVGESRHPEARDKRQDSPSGLVWHFVGVLQSNKARAIARYADVVHSVDRKRLVEPLSRGAADEERTVRCLVQVNLDPEPSAARAGCAPSEVPELADLIAAADRLELGGVMAIAPQGVDPEPVFARLAAIAADLRRDHPGATMLSAGMTGDLEAAVRTGATHVRVGRAVLGTRPSDG
ncbi:MAG TPA: YggS family pyridoxal phosphate-dependent enzyme [Nocardioidaceae bacterium]|nr:YggS family pyridoxal phosphate-dependent enzyme [Nocardioidaceae bacterium]